MILETSELLAYSIISQGYNSPVKYFNPKHPSSLWINLSRGNYLWGIAHLEALISIYDNRYKQLDKYANSRLLLLITKSLLYDLNFKYEQLTLPHLAFTQGNEDLKIKYGTNNGKYYIANSFNDAVLAYREYLCRKSYWKPYYKFES